MLNLTDVASVLSHPVAPSTGRLRLAVAAYLACFTGISRNRTESDLRCHLAWCAERGLDPLAAQRPHLELHIRWMQEIRRFKPSTVSRRFSVTAGLYKTCVLDSVLEHSPAEHVRRPSVPAESPRLGFTHLQFEALLTAARESANRGPLLLNTRGARMDRHAATSRLRHLAEAVGIQVTRAHPHMLPHTYITTSFDAGADLRDVQIAARHADPRTTMRYHQVGPATIWTATRTTSWPPT